MIYKAYLNTRWPEAGFEVVGQYKTVEQAVETLEELLKSHYPGCWCKFASETYVHIDFGQYGEDENSLGYVQEYSK